MLWKLTPQHADLAPRDACESVNFGEGTLTFCPNVQQRSLEPRACQWCWQTIGGKRVECWCCPGGKMCP